MLFFSTMHRKCASTPDDRCPTLAGSEVNVTYCLGISTNEGLVLASDSRTNAGFDQVNTCRKMFQFVQPGERVFVILTSGSLSISQSVISLLRDDFDAGQGLARAKSLVRRGAHCRRLRPARFRHRPRFAGTRLLQLQCAPADRRPGQRQRAGTLSRSIRKEIRWPQPKILFISNSANANTDGRFSIGAFKAPLRLKSPRNTRCSRWMPRCART